MNVPIIDKDTYSWHPNISRLRCIKYLSSTFESFLTWDYMTTKMRKNHAQYLKYCTKIQINLTNEVTSNCPSHLRVLSSRFHKSVRKGYFNLKDNTFDFSKFHYLESLDVRMRQKGPKSKSRDFGLRYLREANLNHWNAYDFVLYLLNNPKLERLKITAATLVVPTIVKFLYLTELRKPLKVSLELTLNALADLIPQDYLHRLEGLTLIEDEYSLSNKKTNNQVCIPEVSSLSIEIEEDIMKYIQPANIARLKYLKINTELNSTILNSLLKLQNLKHLELEVSFVHENLASELSTIEINKLERIDIRNLSVFIDLPQGIEIRFDKYQKLCLQLINFIFKCLTHNLKFLNIEFRRAFEFGLIEDDLDIIELFNNISGFSNLYEICLKLANIEFGSLAQRLNLISRISPVNVAILYTFDLGFLSFSDFNRVQELNVSLCSTPSENELLETFLTTIRELNLLRFVVFRTTKSFAYIPQSNSDKISELIVDLIQKPKRLRSLDMSLPNFKFSKERADLLYKLSRIRQNFFTVTLQFKNYLVVKNQIEMSLTVMES